MKNTKIILLIVCCSLWGPGLFAQDTKFGVRLGVGIPNLESRDNNIYASGFNSVAGFDGGVFLDYGITEKFSLKFELAFARKGGDKDGLQPIPTTLLPPELALLVGDNVLYAEFDNTAIFSYITVPILAKYEWHLGSKWGVYVNGGVYADFIINPTQQTEGESQIFLDPEGTTALRIPVEGLPPNQWPEIPPQDFNTDNDINDDISNMDFGVMLGVGASYAINSKHEIIADIRGSYGLIPLQKDTDIYGDVHMGTLVFSLGYAYTFDKKKKTVD
ncbi:porin family protein [Robiginitalea sp.]|uniref:porin family protein n=1 Tax=Robiginitalea sp. TaxID=1902411 RepID=UPI003C31F37E